MTPNDQPNATDGPTQPVAPPTRSHTFKLTAALLVLGIVLAGGLAGLGLAGCLKPPPSPPAPPVESEVKLPPYLFQGWSKPAPDFVLVLSGEQHGYLMPCGCQPPARRAGLERALQFPRIAEGEGLAGHRRRPRRRAAGPGAGGAAQCPGTPQVQVFDGVPQAHGLTPPAASASTKLAADPRQHLRRVGVEPTETAASRGQLRGQGRGLQGYCS